MYNHRIKYLKRQYKKNEDNSFKILMKLSEGYAIGASAKVEVWGAKAFFMGYNKLTVVVLDSINPADTIKAALIQFMPVLTMPQTIGMPMVHTQNRFATI